MIRLIAMLSLLLLPLLGSQSTASGQTSPRVGDHIPGPFGLKTTVESSDGIGMTLRLDEKTCWGDLAARGLVSPLPAVVVGDKDARDLNRTCGVEPTSIAYIDLRPVIFQDPSMVLPWDGDVTAASLSPTDTYQNTWMMGVAPFEQNLQAENSDDLSVASLASPPTKAAIFAIAIDPMNQVFNVEGDYFEYINLQVNYRSTAFAQFGAPDTSGFVQIGLQQFGPSLTTMVDTTKNPGVDIHSSPVFTTQQAGRAAGVFGLAEATNDPPVTLNGFNIVMLVVAPVYNADGSSYDAIFPMVSSDLSTTHFINSVYIPVDPNRSTIPGIRSQCPCRAAGTTHLELLGAITETANLNAPNEPDLYGYRPSLNPVATFGILEQESLSSPWTLIPHVFMSIEQQAGNANSPYYGNVGPIGTVCPPLQRIFLTNLWVDLNGSSRGPCPIGSVW